MRVAHWIVTLAIVTTGCKNLIVTSTKSGPVSNASSPGAPDPETVPPDFQNYIMTWSKKAECVVTEPQPSPEFDDFQCTRSENWTRFYKAFVDAGRGANGVLAMCKEAEADFGTADGNTCVYGHCGEASAVFGCHAVRRGYPLNQIQICETPNDHIFAMVQQKSGTFCILDRWTVPFTKDTPKATGAVLCDAQVVNGRVTIAGKPSENHWYNDLTCNPIEAHYESSIPAPQPAANQPQDLQEPDDPTVRIP